MCNSGIVKLGKVIDKRIREIIDICARCSSDIVFIGGNFDSMLNFPPFYEKYLLGQFCEWTKILHKNNKKVISHCNDENKDLWELELKSGIDIIEAICVSPMVE